MTGEQYKKAIERLGLTQAAAADFLQVSLRTSAAYAAGDPIPEGVAKLLRLMVKLELEPKDVK